MTDIIASPAVKEAVKVVMEQQERLGDEAAAEARESQPIRTSVLRAAQLAAEAEDHARGRQHVKGKLTARERLDLLLDTGSFEEIGRFRGGAHGLRHAQGRFQGPRHLPGAPPPQGRGKERGVA